MNTKNIILAILMVLSFAACSSEIELDNAMTDANVNSNSETSLSVRMVSNGLDTKGTIYDKDSVERAFSIDSYLIAVFDSETHERVGFTKQGSDNAPQEATVSNIRTKQGKVDVVVIVNLSIHYSDWSLFDAIYTYDEFVDQSVNCLPEGVEVGIEKGVTLEPVASTVTVTLKHMTAHVQVNLSAEKKEDIETNTVVTMVATWYEAWISRESKIIPEINPLALHSGRHDEGVTSFWYSTTKTEAKDIKVWVDIKIDKQNGSEPIVVKKVMDVPFISGGKRLDVLENGISYNIDVVAKVSLTYEVSLSYRIYAIYINGEQEVVFN